MVLFTQASRSVARFAMASRQRVAVPSSRRSFGSAAPRQYEGMEAKVRQYLPEDHHVVMGCLGAYFGTYLFVKLLTSGGGKAEAAPVAAEASSTSTEIPSLVSDEFEEWAKIPGNMEKWEASIESWANKL